jgi:large subunit ribosomal protein L15
MIKLHNLPKITDKKQKRPGRGYGSGKGGHTTFRGVKGTKSRYNVPLTFDGTKIKKGWLKRLPFWPGKGRQKPQPDLIGINVDQLERNYKTGQVVDLESLYTKGLISKKAVRRGVKILGRGKINKKLTVKLPCSEKAKKKIEKAEGSVVEK